MANTFRIDKKLKDYLNVDTKFMFDMENFGEQCGEYVEKLQLSKDMDLLAPETLDKLRDYLTYTNKLVKLNKEFKSILTKNQFYKYKRTIIKWLIDNKMVESIIKEDKETPIINESHYLSLTFILNNKPLQVHQVLDKELMTCLNKNGYNIDNVETQSFHESSILSIEEVDESIAHMAFFFVYYYGVRLMRLSNSNWDRISLALDRNQNKKLKSLDIRAKQGNFTYNFSELVDGRINRQSIITFHCNVCGNEWESSFKKMSCHCPKCAMKKKRRLNRTIEK
jgi:predicted  nucleic acid-binding Zn-ribbon protein